MSYGPCFLAQIAVFAYQGEDAGSICIEVVCETGGEGICCEIPDQPQV